jgi:hypothetical protein
MKNQIKGRKAAPKEVEKKAAFEASLSDDTYRNIVVAMSSQFDDWLSKRKLNPNALRKQYYDLLSGKQPELLADLMFDESVEGISYEDISSRIHRQIETLALSEVQKKKPGATIDDLIIIQYSIDSPNDSREIGKYIVYYQINDNDPIHHLTIALENRIYSDYMFWSNHYLDPVITEEQVNLLDVIKKYGGIITNLGNHFGYPSMLQTLGIEF